MNTAILTSLSIFRAHLSSTRPQHLDHLDHNTREDTMPNITIMRDDFKMQVIPDEAPDTSYLDHDGRADRKALYENGVFEFICVRAVVTIKIPYGSDYIDSKVVSPGLWGIESDSGDDYIRRIYDEEVQVLTDMLDDLNITVA